MISKSWSAALCTVAALAGLAGCSGNSGGGGGSKGGTGGGGSSAGYIYLSGNWEIQATPTSATTPFTALAGFINEQGQNPGVDDLTTAALQVQPSGCYVNATTIPLQGSTQGVDLSLLSFPVNSQFLTIKAKKDATATHLTGSYSISGGCADGATGTLTGTEYADLTGTYAGTVTGSNPAKTMQLDLTQFTQGTGDGVFLEQGSANFTGFACFTKGQLASQNGAVLGSAVSLTFTTNDTGGAQVVMTGTMDSAAQTLTLTSINVNGGTCPGAQGAATLTKQ
jgi:hypothetical protein